MKTELMFIALRWIFGNSILDDTARRDRIYWVDLESSRPGCWEDAWRG